MKLTKKLSLFVLALGLMFGMAAVKSETVSAAGAKASVPKSVRILSDTVCESAITVIPSAYGDKIKALKSSSKNLKVKQSLIHYDQAFGEKEIAFSLYAKKTGKYYITFNICNSKGKKKSSHKIIVYVKNDLPFKSVTYGGEPLKITESGEWNLDTEKTSGKFKVVMNKGYKLKKIQYVETVSCEGDFDGCKKISNNKKIMLPLTMYDEEEEDEIEDGTIIIVTYVDKYTKTEKKVYMNLFLNN